MWLNRDIFTIKLLYETFSDIPNDFRDISRKKQKIAEGFHFLEWFLNQLKIFKFIIHPHHNVCKILPKLKFIRRQSSFLIKLKLYEI